MWEMDGGRELIGLNVGRSLRPARPSASPGLPLVQTAPVMAPSPIPSLSANTNLYKAKRDFQRPTVLSKVS